MGIPQECVLTEHPAKVVQVAGGNYFVDCPVCLTYKISSGASIEIPSKYSDSLLILAAITRRRSDDGNPIFLHEDNVEEILDSVAVPNGLLEQIDEIVKYVYKKTSHAGGGVVINYKNDYPIAF